MTTSGLGDVTLQAIKCLKHSGDKSFEGLTATLLSRLIGVPVRVCKAGYQAGIDALAEIPLAIENKLSQEEGPRLRILEGGLSAAARTYLDLQLWVLVATVEIDPGDRKALEEVGEQRGIGVLILDSAGTHPFLPLVPSISAVCATDPDFTLQALCDQEWLDKKQLISLPSKETIGTDLKAIAASPGFHKWKERLCTILTELPIWRLITERQNRRLLRMLESNARVSLGTAFNPNKVIARTVEAQLTEWLAGAILSPDPEIAIILGERFDGKTWCVFDWLRNQLATLSMPVFFFGSRHGGDNRVSLLDLILANVVRILGSHKRHAAEAIVRRCRDIKTDATPWCLVILDGLNEYVANPSRPVELVAEASGQLDLDCRPSAVLATVRQQSWKDLDGQIHGRKRLITIGPYDDREFWTALRLHGLTENYLESIPVSARDMVRRPRYLDLVVAYAEQLGSYETVTPDVLHWLDARERISGSRPTPIHEWDEESYQGVLKTLAARYATERVLDRKEILEDIKTLVSDARAALDDLKSEGVLVRAGTGYKVSPERLALGMGLYILDELGKAYEQGHSIIERLRDSLPPDRETEEIIAWLRAATTIALLSSPPKPQEIINVLVDE